MRALRVVAAAGSATVMQPGRQNKEPDGSFGPRHRAPHWSPPPPPRTMGDWVTLVVEVGRSQSWESLLAAAEWWVNYVECILLLGVRPRARLLQYALYDAAVPSYTPATDGGRDHPRSSCCWDPPANVTFAMHRMLAAPALHPLPAGVNAHAVVDLRRGMNMVITNI